MNMPINTPLSFKILIVDDNEFYTKILSRFLSNNLKKLATIKGFVLEIISCTSFKCFSEKMDGSVDLLFTDYYLNDGYNGKHILDFIRNKLLKCKVVVVSQVETLQTALLTSVAGAYEFIKKDENTLYECSGIAEFIIQQKLGVIN